MSTTALKPRFRHPASIGIVLMVFLSFAALSWFGYRGVAEWRRSVARLTEKRAADGADLLLMALRRDMRGVQTSVLSSSNLDAFVLGDPMGVSDFVASAFARYPYPESFFGWRFQPAHRDAFFFHRSARLPHWHHEEARAHPFPVVVDRDPVLADILLAQIAPDAAQGRPFSIFEVSIYGRPYQVVARLLYGDVFREQLKAVLAFTVNLSWVREHYFQELTSQVARIAGTDRGLVFRIDDFTGIPVATTHAAVHPRLAAASRTFLPHFFDPLAVSVRPAANVTRDSWSVNVVVASDPAFEGASRTLNLAILAAAVFAIGITVTANAVRTNAHLLQTRADFVSAVTHELKTPITTIRAVGHTLAAGRVDTRDQSREYAQLVVRESERLNRLIDNLLAYARVTDVTEVYAFEPLDIQMIVDETLREFSAQLADFEISVDIAPDTPSIRADRTAIRLALDNLIDNAIRYSQQTRFIEISAQLDGRAVLLSVRDQGIGIPSAELKDVTKKFFRGQRAGSSGSGLGLAIVQRIVADHRGSLAIESAVGVGTVVRVSLPAAATAP
jgi:signal transduction histidine kinase